MIGDLVGPFSLGMGISLAVSSPIEWAIHKYLLHAMPKNRQRNKFIENASRSHNDNHHGAYKGPEHYYRDITNENEVIHFSKSDVGIIAGISAVAGGIMTSGYSAMKWQNLDISDGVFISGVVAGSMAYYGLYEFFHHYMHVIGQRRLQINRVLGDSIQGGIEKRDGNLRLSKPLLDDICNEVEYMVDTSIKKRTKFELEKGLIQRLDSQIEYNTKTRKEGISSSISSREVIDSTIDIMIEREINYRNRIGTQERINHWGQRKIQSFLRNSAIFRYIDNHHFLHHYRYGKNLNVVFPLMDFIMGTKTRSSKENLENNKKFWLCPNSPDVEVFKTKGPRLY